MSTETTFKRLMSAATSLRHTYQVGGIRELGCTFLQMFSAIAKSELGRLRPNLSRHRYWPAFCPELCLISEYWRSLKLPPSVSSQSPSVLTFLRDIGVATSDAPVRTPQGDQEGNCALAMPTIATLESAFRRLYGNSDLRLVPSGDAAGDLAVSFPQSTCPSVSVVIPTRDRADLLAKSVESVLSASGANLDLIIVDNGSTEPATEELLTQLVQQGRCRVLRYPGEFNWSQMNNVAAAQSASDVLLFLNNDIENLDNTWLTNLTSFAQAPGIGVVGPMLLYPDETIQHAGVVVGIGRWPVHIYRGVALADAANQSHAFVSPIYLRSVLAVTGACMAIRRDVFNRLGGFDARLRVLYGDVELCLRAQRAGLRNLYAGHVRLVHHESKTRDATTKHLDDYRVAANLLEPWRTQEPDPCYPAELSRFTSIPRSIHASAKFGEWLR